MKRIVFVFITIIFSIMPISAQDNKTEVLTKAFSQKDWKTFADNFPDTFDAFLDVFGYDSAKGPMPLYSQGYEYINFLFSDERILGDFHLQKLLNLTKGYTWDADGPAILGMNVECLINKYPSIISIFMEDKADILVKDFLKCAIATPHPEPENMPYYSNLLKTIELYKGYSDKIVRLIGEAHKELLEEWTEY